MPAGGGSRSGSVTFQGPASAPVESAELENGVSSVDLSEVVFDAAWDGDQQQPGDSAGRPEPVRTPRGKNTKLPAAASNVSPHSGRTTRRPARRGTHPPVMDMQRRPGCDAGLKQAQGSARRPARGRHPPGPGQAPAGRSGPRPLPAAARCTDRQRVRAHPQHRPCGRNGRWRPDRRLEGRHNQRLSRKARSWADRPPGLHPANPLDSGGR